MSDKLAIIGGVLGLLAAGSALGYYWFTSHRCISLSSFLTILFSTVGVVSGVVLTYSAFTEESKDLGAFAEFRLPLIAGGISLIWVSLQGVIAEWKQPNKVPDPTTMSVTPPAAQEPSHT